MKLDKLDTGAFRPLVPSVSVAMISDFLHEAGWVLADEREGLAEYWLSPNTEADGTEDDTYLLPLNDGMRDYDRRLAELLAGLADYFGDDASQLLQRISSVDWDTLLFRVNPVGPGESVPLAEAASVLAVGSEMLRLSALYTDNPERTGWGSRRSANVADYLRDGVRLGHTRQGSFVFPVMSRTGPWQGSLPPFGRQVMMNLAAALDRVHRWASPGAHEREGMPPFETAVAKSLRPLARAGDLSLHLSFQWAANPPAAEDIRNSSLVFDVSAIRTLDRRAQQPAKALPRSTQDDLLAPAGTALRSPLTITRRHPEQELTGEVIAIGVDDRNAARGENPYFIVLRVRENDYVMAVNHDEHDYALRARADGRGVTARGEVTIREAGATIQGSLVRDQTPSLPRRP
ncbi:hypothetical protein AB0O07_06965 [Streptomyces sp. NPDC093085]|uniref:hypothetical protein n=1 Tax=Streptomyces sp. NPDC093085 TaxID=3155068 RepID=UPI003415BD2E